LERGIFQCFGCGAKGNVLDFAVLMENADPKDGSALRKVAGELQKQFCPELEDVSNEEKKPAEKKQVQAKPKKEPAKDLPVIVNAPLDFELKGLNREHPYLLNRGFTEETIDHFDLGFCSRGLLKDRVAIPLHDHDGKLVAYAGRVVDDETITEDNPRYRFPGKRERDGKLFEFRKTLFLYNGFRIKAPVDDLIVVEGFTSVCWLHQNGFPQVVAVLGSDCSSKQGELIVSLVEQGGCVWILGDGDDAGDRHALNVMREVARHRFVRWVRMADGTQPTNLFKEELKLCFLT
jgi:DNA primase